MLVMGLNVNYNIKVTRIDRKRVFITVFSDLNHDNSGNTHLIQPYILIQARGKQTLFNDLGLSD